MLPPVAFVTAVAANSQFCYGKKLVLLGQRQVLNKHENEKVANRKPTMAQLQSPVAGEEGGNKRGA